MCGTPCRIRRILLGMKLMTFSQIWACLAAGWLVLGGTAHAQDLFADQPFSMAQPPYPLLTHAEAPSALWSDASAPLPTNVWWQNMVLGEGSWTNNALPYIVMSQSDHLRVSMPSFVEGETFVFSATASDVRMSAVEALTSKHVTDHDLASVTVAWSDGAAGTMTAPVVRGMAYATTLYDGLTPSLSTQHATLTVDGAGTSGPWTASRFEWGLNNGQTWIVYASEPVTWFLDNGAPTATGPLNGWVRVALKGSNDEAVLDAHAAAVPTGGAFSATVEPGVGPEGKDVAHLVLDWETLDGGVPLMMSLPHHRAVFDAPTSAAQVAVTYATIKGPMHGVAAASWTMDEVLTDISWSPPTPMDPARAEVVRTALLGQANETINAGDTYFGGKQLAKIARLILIAQELQEAGAEATLRATLEGAMNAWLDGTNGDPLRYDNQWGGLVTASGGSFDMGRYNDHHFHFGYFLYAAAVLAKDHPAWWAAWGDRVMHIVRDIANPAPSDPHYAVTRCKDWFVGHSWASGLFEFGDGRNQESTSEAVNAYYGAFLLGEAVGDDRLRDLGRLMLETEIRTAQTYWQIDSNDGIYPEAFAANKAVGILWSTKVDYATFFGANVEFIHGIQMLPFTPISEELLEYEWIVEEYPVLSQALNDPNLSEGWKGFIVMAHAVIDPDAAWLEGLALEGYDDGNTETNTLHWLATRPGLGPCGSECDGSTGGGGPEGVTFSVDMTEQGPTPQGVFLTGGVIDGWCGTCNPMSDPEGDGIWTLTLALNPGDLVEYKFVSGDWGDEETFDPELDAACTLTTDIFTNRVFTVPASGTLVLPTVCFNSCDACASDPPPPPLCSSDLTGDGAVTIADVLVLLGDFGLICDD